ncbi:hypothetical protein [Flavobacterium hydatis]|uniref:YD repeat-containing protein n=1 Tax=Flavobacterium hydatis TaxID=991 RepID=A0A086AQ50_FLAHY|nr:hypothetical protein [Flavobacterium hydatis]KFF18814.1 hypothetical protein IW20_04395 [Flavobacterium hydatis]OXA88771.1 hypothetical protein B0A62_21240 [Flavobacterium hydatis]
MKRKLLYLFSALLVLTSCSNDETREDSKDNDVVVITPESPVLLQKTIDKDEDGSTRTTVYTYNGNKIVSQLYNNTKEGIYYTYTGDLITKMEFKLADGTIEQVNSYDYDPKGKLLTFRRIDPVENLGNKEVYRYDADGSISVTEYIGDSKTQTQTNATSKITFLNGEVAEIVSTNSPNHKYTYDTKNNPEKNILGMDKIAFVDGEADGTLHNTLTDTSGDKLSASYSYTYNVSDYPATSIETSSEGKVTTQYFYNELK